jgi:crossover junction endodeoxyribonuclease RusA
VSLSIEFEPPERCLTMNQRLHWAQKSKISRLWRDAAEHAGSEALAVAAFDHGYTLEPSLVTVYLPVKGNRRRDPHNYFPTVKPIVDGLVDAGLWPDDTPEWVRCIEPTLVVGAELVTVVLEPM